MESEIDPVESPAESGQDTGHQSEGGSPPDGQAPQEGQADADGSSDAALSPDELAKLPPQDKGRVEGIVKAYQRKMSDLETQKRELSELTAAIREQTASIGERESAGQKSRFDTLLEKLGPSERPIVSELYAALRDEVQGKIVAPIANRVAQDSQALAWDRARMKYKDFDQVVHRDSIRNLPQGVNDPDVAYRLLAFDHLARENSRAQTELARAQKQQKLSAGTERPGGPSADALLAEEYENLPFEERRKLPMSKLLALAERKIARR